MVYLTYIKNYIDLICLVFQTAELPHDLRSRLMCGPLQFVPKFIYVEEEWLSLTGNDDRVNLLLNKYKRENGKSFWL